MLSSEGTELPSQFQCWRIIRANPYKFNPQIFRDNHRSFLSDGNGRIIGVGPNIARCNATICTYKNEHSTGEGNKGTTHQRS